MNTQINTNPIHVIRNVKKLVDDFLVEMNARYSSDIEFSKRFRIGNGVEEIKGLGIPSGITKLHLSDWVHKVKAMLSVQDGLNKLTDFSKSFGKSGNVTNLDSLSAEIRALARTLDVDLNIIYTTDPTENLNLIFRKLKIRFAESVDRERLRDLESKKIFSYRPGVMQEKFVDEMKIHFINEYYIRILRTLNKMERFLRENATKIKRDKENGSIESMITSYTQNFRDMAIQAINSKTPVTDIHVVLKPIEDHVFRLAGEEVGLRDIRDVEKILTEQSEQKLEYETAGNLITPKFRR